MKLFLSVFFLVGAALVCSGQDTNVHSVLTYGQVTNATGIRGELEVVTHDAPGHLTEILVWVNQTAPTNAPTHPFDRELYHEIWDYYYATNIFCGFIELRDKSGKVLPLLKPEINSLETYPAKYNLIQARNNYFKQFFGYSGPYEFPWPLMYLSSRSEIVRFQIGEPLTRKSLNKESMLYERWYSLRDFFAIKEPGEYTFTVWPKVYHLISTNSRDCERLDLPPVTATFKWDGNQAK